MAVDAARVKSLLLAASELADVAARAALLDGERGGDGELWARVEALLPAYDAASRPAPAPTDTAGTIDPDAEIEALEEALSRLAIEQSHLVELMQLRYFGGLTLAQGTELLGVSPRTTDSWWAYARAWLAVDLKKS